ncbi:hypothetical protein KCV07_g284, partial [Aureobasidium melanogenum]
MRRELLHPCLCYRASEARKEGTRFRHQGPIQAESAAGREVSNSIRLLSNGSVPRISGGEISEIYIGATADNLTYACQLTPHGLLNLRTYDPIPMPPIKRATMSMS